MTGQPEGAVRKLDLSRLGSAESLVWSCGLAVVVALLGVFPVVNGDIWWHLRTGELIWQRGAVPRTDWFTYTNPDVPWFDLHWGFQLIAVGLWNAGGQPLLVLARVICGIAAFGLGFAVCRMPRLAAIGWLAAICLFSRRYFVRPEMLSYVLLAATILIMHRSERKPMLLWLLPFVQLVWVNVHGLFCLQYVVVGAYLGEMLLRRILPAKTKPSADGQQETAITPRLAMGVVAAMLAASLLNPYGFRGVLFPLTLMEKIEGADRSFYYFFSPELRGFDSIVRERGWLTWFDDWALSLATVLLIAGLVTSVLLWRHRGLPVARVLMLMAFAYITWKMERNVLLFAIVVGTVLQMNLADLKWPPHSTHTTPRGNWVWLQFQRVATAALLGASVLVVCNGSYYRWTRHDPLRQLAIASPAWRGLPAMEFLQRPGMPRRLYACGEKLAAQCIYYLGPEQRVYADARLELNTRETLQKYFDIQFQLAAHDPAALSNLRGPDEGPLPALVFDNLTMLNFSVNEPRLLPGLATDDRWLCVFSTAADDVVSQEGSEFVDGVTVFLPRSEAERLKLPEAPIRGLLQFADVFRSRALRGGP